MQGGDTVMRQYVLPGFLVLADIFTLIMVAFISLFLRFGELVIDAYFVQIVVCLPFFVISYLLMLAAMHLYTRVWRYAAA
jgi:FlaA1/EpsC-like NDP-sugar epimerase